MNIGAKIKELRKERKMTLAQVAGNRLTKGMLSLIENGKAQPSMESLQHIANQLEIDVAELIQSENQQKIYDTFMKVEQSYTQLSKEFNKEQMKIKREELLQQIEPFVKTGMLRGTSYEEVRLYHIYLLLRYYLKLDCSLEPFLPLATMYENVRAYSKMLSCFSLLGALAFTQHHYEQAVLYLEDGKPYLERYHYLIDDVEKLDFYYHFTVFYAALNNDKKTEYYLNLALTLAKDQKIFYRLNDFYRFLFYLHAFNGEAEKSKEYLEKIQAFATLLDEEDAILAQLMTLVYINHIECDYEKTLATSICYFNIAAEARVLAENFASGEYAYAYLQLGHYAQAKSVLENYFIPENLHHPLDLGSCYRTYAIRALCYLEEGDLANAKRDILYAMDGVKGFKQTFDKQFIVRAYEKIMH